MAVSGRDRSSSIAGGWRICGLVTQLIALSRGRKEEFAECVVEAMADRGHSAWTVGALGYSMEGLKGEGVVLVLAWKGRIREKTGSS